MYVTRDPEIVIPYVALLWAMTLGSFSKWRIDTHKSAVPGSACVMVTMAQEGEQEHHLVRRAVS